MPLRASLTIFLIATAVLVGCGGDDDSERAPEPAVTGPLDEKGSDLFVVRGPAVVADGRIEVTTEVVEWFNERPQRNAGVGEANELVENWKEYGFESEPPNAALAGESSDGVVELTMPEITDDGVSFAYKTLRGEIASEDAGMSVFIDSSEWETDMHVYVKDVFCEDDPSTLSNPQIIDAPSDWSKYPVSSQDIYYNGNPENPQWFELFTAASKSGGTSFEVQYDLSCPNYGVGTITFKGHVPDSLSSDSFSCSVNGGALANCSQGGGYHVDARTEFEIKG